MTIGEVVARPPLPLRIIKSEIREKVKSGRTSHHAVREYIRKKYPDYELGGGYFRQAIKELVDSGEIREVHSRLEPVKK